MWKKEISLNLSRGGPECEINIKLASERWRVCRLQQSGTGQGVPGDPQVAWRGRPQRQTAPPRGRTPSAVTSQAREIPP